MPTYTVQARDFEAALVALQSSAEIQSFALQVGPGLVTVHNKLSISNKTKVVVLGTQSNVGTAEMRTTIDLEGQYTFRIEDCNDVCFQDLSFMNGRVRLAGLFFFV